MARPTKTGLDYFPLDTSLDDNVELLEAECGLEGFAILIKLYQKIYANGYYIEWSEDNALLFARKINSELTLVSSVINACFHRNLLSKSMYNKHKVLTSCGIQKRYLKVVTDAKRKNIKLRNELILIKPELIPDLIELIQEESTQRKEKKRREEKTTLEIAIDDFKKHRKQLKKPMTDRAVELLILKLDKMAHDDETKIAIIDQAIENGWQSVYELKTTPNKQTKPKLNIVTSDLTEYNA